MNCSHNHKLDAYLNVILMDVNIFFVPVSAPICNTLWFEYGLRARLTIRKYWTISNDSSDEFEIDSKCQRRQCVTSEIPAMFRISHVCVQSILSIYGVVGAKWISLLCNSRKCMWNGEILIFSILGFQINSEIWLLHAKKAEKFQWFFSHRNLTKLNKKGKLTTEWADAINFPCQMRKYIKSISVTLPIWLLSSREYDFGWILRAFYLSENIRMCEPIYMNIETSNTVGNK